MAANNYMPSALIVGFGAIGGFYGSLLARQGWNVDALCRSNASVIREFGMQIQSPSAGSWNFHPRHVFTSIPASGEYDFLLLTVKVLDHLDRAALIRPAVGARTAIVLIENGLYIEDPIVSAFPENAVISALAFVCVTQPEPGIVEHQAYGRLVLGDYPGGIGPGTRTLQKAFQAGGIECSITSNIIKARWGKCVWNSSFNPISVLAGGRDTRQIMNNPELRQLVIEVMQEILLLAAADGNELDERIIERNLTDTDHMPPYATSMLNDYQHRRPMEVDAILGTLIRFARAQNLSVPRLETLYKLMLSINETMLTQSSPGYPDQARLE